MHFGDNEWKVHFSSWLDSDCWKGPWESLTHWTLKPLWTCVGMIKAADWADGLCMFASAGHEDWKSSVYEPVDVLIYSITLCGHFS